MPEPQKPKRGFARLGEKNPQRQQEIASLGGKAAHKMRRAHEFTTQEAQAAGKKGGLKVSQDRAYMSRIGQRGGMNRRGFRTANPQPLQPEGAPDEGNDFHNLT